MKRWRTARLLTCALIALLCLICRANDAAALTLAYDRNYGTAYMNILRNACEEPMEMRGYTRSRLELFQTRLVDAIEVYDFEAERYRRGTTEELYWYPHDTAKIVHALR